MIRVFEPSLTWKDKISVLKDLNKNNISGQSPSVKQFENACASRFDRNFGVAVSNGSVALDLAFQSLDHITIVYNYFVSSSCNKVWCKTNIL
jgi:perosamine synthetase